MYMTLCFTFVGFRIFLLYLTFFDFNYDIPWSGFFFWGTVYASRIRIVVSFFRLRSFNHHLIKHIFGPLICLSPSETLIKWTLLCLMFSQRALKLFFLNSSFFLLFKLGDFHDSIFQITYTSASANLLLIILECFHFNYYILQFWLVVFYIFCILAKIFAVFISFLLQFSNSLKNVYLLIINWRMIALQCYIGFCHTTLWLSHTCVCVYIYTHTHIYALPLEPPSHPTPPSYSSKSSQSTRLSSVL